MIITYQGLESFKIQLGSATFAFNPVSKKSKEKSVSFGADVAVISVDHPDMNGVDAVSRGDKEPFLVNGPGEYEIQNVFIRGFSSKTAYEKRTHNTIYLIQIEDMHVCFLGALAETELPKDFLEEIEEVDVLFVPVGGNGVLSPKEAHKLAVQLEAKIVIPMHYSNTELTAFLKEEGVSNSKPADKLTLKKKDLLGKSGDVAVLKAS